MAELPAVIPLFPLPDVVLFPRVLLPLHLFEPRYRAMARDAVDGDGLIGMVLLRGDWRSEYHGRPDVFRTGTVGRIQEHSKLSDGRHNVLLAGVREFRIEEEFTDRVYRYARVAWRPCADGGLSVTDRQGLLAVTRTDLARRDRSADTFLARLAEADDESLVNSLCQAMELSAVERLWLLECTSLETRAQRLRELLEFRIEETRAGGSHSGGGIAH